MLKLTTFIVNGYPQSGKDEFIRALCQTVEYKKLGVMRRISTIDPVKDVLRNLGWDGSKDPEDRKMLSDLKDYWTKKIDGSFNYVRNTLYAAEQQIEYTGHNHPPSAWLMGHAVLSREPQEIARFKHALPGRVYTIYIERQGHTPEISNRADKNVQDFDYDFKIINKQHPCWFQELTIHASDLLENLREDTYAHHNA